MDFFFENRYNKISTYKNNTYIAYVLDRLINIACFYCVFAGRESKRRAEWQLEYRYLSRHEAHSEKKCGSQPLMLLLFDTNVAESSRFEADFDDVTEDSISTNIMGRHKRPVNIPKESPQNLYKRLLQQ